MKEARTPSRLLLILSSGVVALLFAQNLLHAQAPGKIPPPTKTPSLPVPPMTPTPQLPPTPSDFLYTADTNELAKKQGLVKLGNFSWGCQGLRCTAKSTAPTPDVAGCKALAEQIGQIKSYGHPAKQLNVGELKQCNAGITVAAGPNVPPANPGTVPQVGQTQKPQQSSGQQQGGSDPNQPAKTPAGQGSQSQQSSGPQQSGSQSSSSAKPSSAPTPPASGTPSSSSSSSASSGSTPPPDRASTPEPSGAPVPFRPVTVAAAGFRLTGEPLPPAASGGAATAPFRPVTVSAAGFRLTGGPLPAPGSSGAPIAPFRPVTVTTAPFTLRGQ